MSFSTRSWLVTANLIGLVSCGGGLNPPASQLPFNNNTTVSVGSETGPPSAVVSVPGSATAVVALFPDGRAFYSPDGYNIGGGGATVVAYGGTPIAANVVALNDGIVTLLADGSAYYSPDGKNLGGGGSTVPAYNGPNKVAAIVRASAGVDAVFADPGTVYYSPNGRDLGGGGQSVLAYGGGKDIAGIVPVGATDAVVTLFQDGTAYYSPDNRNLGGGGNTISAAPNTQSQIKQLVGVGGGVMAEFAGGTTYLSPNGQQLAGGGSTVVVNPWDASIPNGPFGRRDSAHGTTFAGRLWLSGGFADAGTSSCFLTCSYYDLWSSVSTTGASWNAAPSFATAAGPDPRDATPVVNNGVQDVAVPTDFYDSYSPIVVWNNQLFAIGATIWSSVNGTTWARTNLPDGTPVPGPNSGGQATENSRVLQLGTVLFFLQPDSGGVYSSTDANAASWTNLGTIQGFKPRCGAAAFVLLDKLWIVGGGACNYSQVYNDIWSSADGVNWTKSDTAAAWSARMWPCVATTQDGIVWLAAGYAPTDWNSNAGVLTPRYGANHSDVWYTKDAITWRQYKADYGSGLPDGNTLEPRHAATCYVDSGSGAAEQALIVIAGTAGPTPNDANAEVSNSIRTVALPAASALP